jgi:predicted nucleic acid-binding protein
MTGCVLDASVVAAALFREDHADVARDLLVGNHDLLAPDLIHAELANVIWKRSRVGEINRDEARDLLADILALPMQIIPAAPLIDAALALAMRSDRTAYDCLYLAAAIAHDAPLFTADRRFVNALAATPLATHIRWIGAA